MWGYSGGVPVTALPLETCETMNGAWGYRVDDQNYKTLKEIVNLLVRSVAKDANLLLNIGPMADGSLPAPALDRLKQLGGWMRQNGHTVNGCGATGIAPEPWGVTTRDKKHLYVHILEPSKLPSGENLTIKMGSRTFSKRLPAEFDPVDTIITIRLY